MEVGGRWKTNK